MMRIYDCPGTPNAARIRIVVAEKNLEKNVRYINVDLIKAEQKQPAFLKMNPIGKTPVLELHDGLCISESTAITEYLDNLDGNPVLTGTTARAKAIVHMMQRRVEMLLLETVDDYFHYATPGLGKTLEPWRMPGWGGAKEWGQMRGAVAVDNIPYFDKILSDRPFLAGDDFSMADISLFAGLTFADDVKLHISPDLEALSDWRNRVSELPAVKNRSGQDFLPPG